MSSPGISDWYLVFSELLPPDLKPYIFSITIFAFLFLSLVVLLISLIIFAIRKINKIKILENENKDLKLKIEEKSEELSIIMETLKETEKCFDRICYQSTYVVFTRDAIRSDSIVGIHQQILNSCNHGNSMISSCLIQRNKK
jgi:hypothetical protein